MGDPRIHRILGPSRLNPALIAAAYADSTWDKIVTTLNVFEKFERYKMQKFPLPLNSIVVSDFIHWASFERNLAPSSITAYISNLKLVHNLRNLDASACENMLCKTQIRGAKNLMFYRYSDSNHKKVMTLPLLKLMGHEIEKANGLICQKV